MQPEVRWLREGIRHAISLPNAVDRLGSHKVEVFVGVTTVLLGCTIGVFWMDTSHLNSVPLSARSGQLTIFINAFVLGAFSLLPISEAAAVGFGVFASPFLLQGLTALSYLYLAFFPDDVILQCREGPQEEYCVMPLRAMFWLISTTIMIYIKQVSRSSCAGALTPTKFFLTLVANWIMHLTGLVYQREVTNVRYYALALSLLCFGYVMQAFWEMLTPEVGCWGSEVLRAMRTLDMVTWALFPIVVFAYDYEMFNYDQFHCICGLLDIVAKGLYLQLLRSYRNAQLQGERDQMILRPQKDYFLQTIHELRNPLNACIACSEEAETNSEEMWRVVRDACEHMKQLVTDLLDNASQQVTLADRSFQLSEVLGLSQRLTKYRSQSCGVAVEVSVNDDQVFQGDPLRVTQIVTNLLDNAIKFSKRGGKPVIVSTWHDSALIYISVQDFGFGMSKKQVDGLFTTMFTQYHSGTVAGGSGVGLVLCANLAKAMNGKIGVESAEGKGSRFTLTLPARIPPTPRAPSPQLMLAPTPQTVVRRLSHIVKSIVCLVVDDSKINARLLCRQLEAVGVLGPRSAFSGREALTIIENDKTINVVLLDQQLGDMTGNEVVVILRAMVRDVPLHVVSFSGSEVECPEGLYNYVLKKPVSRATILTWLAHYQQVNAHVIASQLPAWA